LGKLESKLKVPDHFELDNRVVAKALSNLSIEDLRLLREGALTHPARAAFNPSPEYEEVFTGQTRSVSKRWQNIIHPWEQPGDGPTFNKPAAREVGSYSQRPIDA
jgi:hypothetical protein